MLFYDMCKSHSKHGGERLSKFKFTIFDKIFYRNQQQKEKTFEDKYNVIKNKINLTMQNLFTPLKTEKKSRYDG